MTKSTHKQLEFQRRVIAACGRDPTPYEEYLKIWWWNPTNHASLRLTRYGLVFFTKELEIETYTVKLAQKFNFKQLIQLERLFQAPYFLKNGAILVFSEQDAIMLQLHAGDLAQYLDNLETNK